MTPNFSVADLIYSKLAQEKGIDNTPPPVIARQLLATAAGLERIRAMLNVPMRIHSGFRCYALNNALGGSPNSQHIKGEAADFDAPAFGSPKEICLYLAQENRVKVLGIDQLIMEGTWVHASFTLTPRYQLLTKTSDGKYLSGIV
jgi:zinc D-Ala-D-Ala carboxypeptidase